VNLEVRGRREREEEWENFRSFSQTHLVSVFDFPRDSRISTTCKMLREYNKARVSQ